MICANPCHWIMDGSDSPDRLLAPGFGLRALDVAAGLSDRPAELGHWLGPAANPTG
jgi:hypothetical protein